MSKRWVLWIVLGASGGCASSRAVPHDDAGPGSDAQVIDAPRGTDAAQVTPAAQITPAAGRITGGTYTMDVQLGTPFSQKPAAAGAKTFQANSPVKP